MIKKIYVGNMPYTTTEDELRELFEKHGAVQSVKMISDHETGRFRGFGFVEMEEAEADTAISALNGEDMGGRSLRVNESRKRESGRPPGKFSKDSCGGQTP